MNKMTLVYALILSNFQIAYGSTCDEAQVRKDVKANVVRLFGPDVSDFRITMNSHIGVKKVTDYLVFFKTRPIKGSSWIAAYDLQNCYPVFEGATNTTDDLGNP